MVIWSEFRTWQKCVDNKFEMLVTEAIAEDKRQAQKS